MSLPLITHMMSHNNITALWLRVNRLNTHKPSGNRLTSRHGRGKMIGVKYPFTYANNEFTRSGICYRNSGRHFVMELVCPSLWQRPSYRQGTANCVRRMPRHHYLRGTRLPGVTVSFLGPAPYVHGACKTTGCVKTWDFRRGSEKKHHRHESRFND